MSFQSFQQIFKLTPKTEKILIQRHIRRQWKNKSAVKPFLGADTIQVRNPNRNITVTQEQYATQWLKWTVMEQRRLPKKHESNESDNPALEDAHSDDVRDENAHETEVNREGRAGGKTN
jgi:hypothetical protein